MEIGIYNMVEGRTYSDTRQQIMFEKYGYMSRFAIQGSQGRTVSPKPEELR